MTLCLRYVRWGLLLVCLTPWSAGSASAQARAEHDAPDYPRLDDSLQSLEREPVLLIAEGLEPLLDPDALRERLAALFGRPVVSLSDPEAGAALATVYCARAPAGRRQGFVTLRLSTQGVDLWQRLPARSLSGDAAGAIADAVIDMLWSDRIASLSGPELLDPFCPPGLTCVDSEHASLRTYAARRAPESALVDPWDAREPRFTLLESRAYWTRGDPWGAPSTPRSARPDGGVSSAPERTK